MSFAGPWLERAAQRRARSVVITITHPEKLLFPQSGIAKREYVEYYHRTAAYMLSIDRVAQVHKLRGIYA